MGRIVAIPEVQSPKWLQYSFEYKDPSGQKHAAIICNGYNQIANFASLNHTHIRKGLGCPPIPNGNKNQKQFFKICINYSCKLKCFLKKAVPFQRQCWIHPNMLLRHQGLGNDPVFERLSSPCQWSSALLLSWWAERVEQLRVPLGGLSKGEKQSTMWMESFPFCFLPYLVNQHYVIFGSKTTEF